MLAFVLTSDDLERMRNAFKGNDASLQIATGFTRLRQIINLHNGIPLKTKERLLETSQELQETMVTSLGTEREEKTALWSRLIEIKGKDLESSAKQLEKVQEEQQKASYQEVAERIAAQLLEILEVACKDVTEIKPRI